MKSDEPRLFDTGNGVTVRYRNRNLYSSADPAGSAVKRVERFLSGPHIDRTLVFVPSLGLGYGLRELLAGLPASSCVVCVETDQALFATALAAADIPVDDRIKIVRTDVTRSALSLIYHWGVWRFRRLKTLPLCGGYGIHRDVYDEMAGAMEREIQTHWQNRMTLISMGRLWLRNLIANLGVLDRCSDIGTLSVDRPILVVGAGPSLDTGAPWIRQHRDRLYVMVVDTAVPVLSGWGIEPDSVFVLEAQVINLLDFVGANADTPLVADLTSTPALLRQVEPDRDDRPVYLYSSRFAPLRLLDRMDRAGLRPTVVPPLGSVGVAALHVALQMTRAAVIVTGLDFGFTGGKTHARGAPSHLAWVSGASRTRPAFSQMTAAMLNRRLLRVPGKDGPTLTDTVLRTYAEQAARVVTDTGRVYDLDAAGMGIGAPAVTCHEDEVLSESPRSPRAQATQRRWDADRVRDFATAELTLLGKAADRIGQLLRSRQDPGEQDRRLLRDLDYLAIDFADYDGLEEADHGFLARIRREIGYYHTLWRRLL